MAGRPWALPVYSYTIHQGLAREAVHGLKYEGKRVLAEPMAHQMHAAFPRRRSGTWSCLYRCTANDSMKEATTSLSCWRGAVAQDRGLPVERSGPDQAEADGAPGGPVGLGAGWITSEEPSPQAVR